MELTGEDEDADSRQHPGDDGRRDGAKPAAVTEHTGDELEDAGDQDGQPEDFQAKFPHEFIHDDRQTSGRPADLERGTGDPADDEPTDDAGDESRGNRNSRCDGDSHA